MIDRREPLAPQPFPALRVGERAHDRQRDERHERGGAHDDRLIERDGGKRQFTEHALPLRPTGGVRQIEDAAIVVLR
ncbi:hypothetical protein, partial [Burkholderia mallei]|uniref:hypothetical protein n=1 Tax=Burkholderia mallei TaxID=13373 RepID=UPI00209A86C8